MLYRTMLLAIARERIKIDSRSVAYFFPFSIETFPFMIEVTRVNGFPVIQSGTDFISQFFIKGVES